MGPEHKCSSRVLSTAASTTCHRTIASVMWSAPCSRIVALTSSISAYLVTKKEDAAAALTTTTPAPAPTTGSKVCATAPFASECYNRVQWVMRYGVIEHPEWYPNLTLVSTFEEIQATLYGKNECNCAAPCKPALDPSSPAFLNSTLLEQPGPGALVCKVAAPQAGSDVGNTTEDSRRRLMGLSSPVWRLPRAALEECFDALVEAKVVTQDDHEADRNWCWVGMKEFGCHRHFYDHLSWSYMQDLAVAAGVSNNVSFQALQRPDLCDNPEFGGTAAWTHANWSSARKWFTDNVRVYVLSLKTNDYRRNIIKGRLDRLQISFSFVDGVDMRVPDAVSGAKDEGLIPRDFNITLAQQEAYSTKQNMGTAGSIVGTVGCASGHFRAQDHARRNNPKNITLVFEDDVTPVDDFIPKLWRLVTHELPCEWQAVSLYSRCPFGECISPHLTRVLPDVNEPAWRCRHGVNYGFQGMLYRTHELESLQRFWKPVVFNEKRPHCLDVDVALASISDTIHFYAVPASHNPGFLREVSEGSTRVDINFQKMTTMPLTTTATATTTTAVQTDSASPKTSAAPPPAPSVPTFRHPYCGNKQGSDGCRMDGRAKGWCSESQGNCKECAGKWCTPDAHQVELRA
mmetsp:Transcript_12547/g.36562  ORF Transcript_12547/g.36562 Transcript_12547/m.36562 type:complete len:629 (+) Transcript_12547:384-2270(+)